MSFIVVIPARYGSSRLPGKPLVDIAGVPMIIRTCRQCLKAVSVEALCVATDDKRIERVCSSEGIGVVMTDPDCLTGTDRVAEVAKTVVADTYINVQGDEPLFNPGDLKLLIETAEKKPNEVINGYCSIEDEEVFRSNTPKVVFRSDGRLLYMSRASLPTTKTHRFQQAWRQVCAYAFPRKALKDFSTPTQKTLLESIEDIEILRFLELGWEVRMIRMSDVSISVDSPEDVSRVEAALIAQER